MILQLGKNLCFIIFLLLLFQQQIESKSIDRIPKLENGFVDIHDSGHRYSFHCKDGFQLVGKNEIYYENNKWSDNIPICVQIKAQIDFPFGHYLVSEEGRKYTFFCNEGYHLQGEKEIKFENKKWSGSVPKCIENEDGDENDDNGNNDDEFTDEISEPKETDKKIEIVMKDNENDGDDNDYDNDDNVDDDNDNNTKNNESKWTIEIDENCSNMMEIILKNGFVLKMMNKCKWIFQCNQGFILIGNSEIEFLNNKWTNMKPICVPTHDLEIKNGNFEMKNNSGNYILHYKCNNGYKLEGDGEVIITNGDIFPLKKPSCQALCPLIPFCFGQIKINEASHVANFICDEGYQLKGHFESVCENGKWNHPAPICIPSCPKIDLMNGEVTINENIATFNCKENYNLIGSNNSFCHEGQWLEEIPICAPKCPTLKITQAHKIMALNLQSTYYKFSCKEGYIMRGKSEIFCRFGQWNQPVPICEIKKPYYQATNGFTINTVASECHIL